MPSTATLHSIELNGYNTLCSVTYASASTCEADYPGNTRGDSDGADYTTKEDLAVQLLDNRLSLSATTAYFPTTADSALENGTALPSPRANRIMPGSLQGPGELFWYGTSATESEFQGWASRYTSNSWFNLPNGTYNYLIDEPGSTCSHWTSAISFANTSRSWTTPNMPMLVTANIADTTSCSALNAVDWLVPNIIDMEPGGNGGSTTDQRSTYNTWLSGNCCSGSGPTRVLWSYLSCDPDCGGADANPYPNYIVDAYPVANRAMEWMSFRNTQSGELYYLLDACFDNTNGCGYDPWNSVHDAGNNGDGDLVYPGSNSTNCGGTCSSPGSAKIGVSIPIWIPSIRLKMMRDGMQDYEYLNLLTNQGQGSLVQSEISSWITNAYAFSVNPSGLTTARQALGQAIHQLTYPVTVQPPTNVTVTVEP
jgi:hypothetical protein